MNNGRWLSYLRNDRFQSLYMKNLLLILVLTFLPFVGTGVAVYHQMNEIVREEIGAIHVNSLYRIRDVVDNVIQQTDRMATKLSLQPEVELFLYAGNPEQVLNSYYREMYRSISLFTTVYKHIDSIYIFSEKNQYIIANSAGMEFRQFADRNWHPLFKQRQNNDPWIMPRKREDKYPFYITLVRPAYIYNQQQLGAVIVNINMEELGQLIRGQRSASEEKLYIVDGNGTIMFSDDKQDFLVPHEDSVLAEVSLAGNGGSLTVEGQDYLVSVAKSQVFDWTYASVLPVQHYQDKIHGLQTFMLVLSAIGFAALTLVVFLISARTFAPVKRIMSAFDPSPEGRTGHAGSPEMQYILSHIDKSHHSQRELEKELDRRLELLNKARSVALQSQINPHFLFNTLDTIRWTAIRLTGGDNETSRMISSLSELMRLSMDADSHLIPLSSEAEHARKYIEIIRYRYRDKVSVHWDIPSELADCKVVQLSLQPLIENAVYHGIKPMRRKGNIWISAQSIGSNLIIEVRDDGRGMDPERVRQWNEELGQTHDLTGKHIGLQNVNQRIKILFGPQCGLTVHGNGDQGLTVTIWLPMTK